jgi:hypothetical protein
MTALDTSLTRAEATASPHHRGRPSLLVASDRPDVLEEAANLASPATDVQTATG